MNPNLEQETTLPYFLSGKGGGEGRGSNGEKISDEKHGNKDPK